MSLEQQLIRGAGMATGADTRGIVARAESKAWSDVAAAGKEITDTIAANQKAIKDAEKAHSDQFDKNEEELLDNQGLGPVAYAQAVEEAEAIKETFNACADDPDPKACRRKSTMELNTMAQRYEKFTEDTKSVFETKDKIANGDLDLSDFQSFDDKARLAGVQDANKSSRYKNDLKIEEVNNKLKATLDPDEKDRLKKELKTLQETNGLEDGYQVSYRNEKGDMVEEFLTPSDLTKLQPLKANVVKNNYNKRQLSNLENIEKLKNGSGGKDLDMVRTVSHFEDEVSEKNINSIYHDNLLGAKLKEDLKYHPMLRGASYKDLGITVVGNGDDIIDDEEIDQVISMLSDPNYMGGKYYNFDVSKEIAVEWMALKEKKQHEIGLFGPEYHPKPGSELTYNGQTYNTLGEYQQAIYTDKTTLRNGGRENEADFLKRGGVRGLMQSGTVLVQREEGVIAQSVKKNFELNP